MQQKYEKRCDLADHNESPEPRNARRLKAMTSAKQEIVGVFSRAAPSYDVVGPRQFSYFAGRLVEFVDPEAGIELLDVATGTGATLLAVAERLADSGRLVGVDLSPEMLERAAERVRERSLVNVSLHLMDAEALKFADESFDCVLSSFGLSSLPDKPGALQEFRRVLRPGGRIGLLDAFGWYFQHDPRWAWQEEVLRSFGVLRDYHWTDAEAELVQALGQARFCEVETASDACPLVFSSDEQWWRWIWSHGTRRLLETVPRARRDELKHALLCGLASCREDDGLIHGTLRAALARARKPA